MIDALSMTFMQNALLAGILASIICGIIGTLVVVNRLVFLAGGIAHAAYGGVGLAFFCGLPVLPCTIAFSLLVSTLMGFITEKNRQDSDTIIGVLWAAGMALGILLLDLTPGYNVDLISYLFGSILTVPRWELWVMAGLVIFLLAIVTFFYRPLLSMSFESEFAKTRGVPVRGLYLLLLAMAALSIVLVIQVVGLILVIALLTIPSYLAQRHSTSLAGMMVRASLWSLLFTLTGLTCAYQFDLTSGASIIAVGTICFFAVLLKDRILKQDL